MKKILFSSCIAVAMFLFLTQCQEKVGQDMNEPVLVSFVLNNPAMDLSGSRQAGEPADEAIPTCSDGIPAYVHIMGTGPMGAIDENLDILKKFENGTQTVVVKLPPGDYAITDFEVYDEDDNILYASPKEGSYYDDLFGFDNNVTVEFTLEPFTKMKVNVDVLCWEDYSYKEFGYVWYDFDKFRVRTLCFFGDICTKFYKTWHMQSDVNPYFGQGHDGYDFPAIITVVIKKDGEAINKATNLDWQGTGAPLCIEYLDEIAVEGEEFTAELWLYLPDGSMVLLDEIPFTDADHSEGGGTWGGEDGIFDFAVGAADACKVEGANAFYELPWVPLPDDISFILRQSSDSYFDFELTDVQPFEINEFTVGNKLHAWCGDPTTIIYWNAAYDAKVYPYFNIPDDVRLSDISAETWSMVHWIVNEVIGGPHPVSHIQNAIWKILGYTHNAWNNPIGDDGGLVAEAMGQKDYKVPLGGYIVVLIDPTNPDNPDAKVQLGLVRFDP